MNDSNRKTDYLLYNKFMNEFENMSGTLIDNATLTAKVLNNAVLDLDTVQPNPNINRVDKGQRRTNISHIVFLGKTKMVDTSDAFSVFGSNDGTNYFKIQAIRPFTTNITAEGTGANMFHHFCYKMPLICRYYKLGMTNDNTNDFTNFTCHFNLLVS